ncbi:flagellar export protein FliJ [Moorella naiadis]|uniref:flagellar export protein FliJ n=1 Tax=Moorella naiadis (nom. illeg.) TaxID=3093670 RepID=UPI003D9C93ED
MARFQFSLEKVRAYRSSLEKQLKLQLAEARCRQEEAEACLNRYREMRAGCPVIRGAVAGADLLREATYIEALDGRIAGQQAEVARVSQVVNKRRDQVQEAMQERKVLDRLRERQLQAYRYVVTHEEQKQIDETAGNRYFRGMKE